jgi:hypothetical protein
VERAFARLIDILSVAASQLTAEYFQLPVADGDAVYRERVYCYELYYQLRCRWDGFPFSLGGEVDKVGHPHFQNGPYARAKPDLLVHVPGQMSHNLATVEVKPATVRDEDLRSDLRKLSWFCRHAQYFRGVVLVYGDAGDTDSLRARLQQVTDDQVEAAVLTCLYHRTVGRRPETLTL